MAEESSATRRERLLALRSVAETPPSTAAAAAAAAAPLPDPDLHSVPSTPQPQPRFDYYTNPTAAFASASNKRKAPAPPPLAGSANYASNFSCPPPHQHHMSRSPGRPPFPMAPDAPPGRPWRSPMQFQPPMAGYRGTPHSASPPWSPSTTPPAQGSYPNSSRSGFASSNFGRSCSPMNYGPRGSPYTYSGRGRGQHHYSSPGSRGNGGRGGLGFQNRAGWQDRRSYYSKCMVEDPWQDLQAVVGNILIPRDGPNSWLPKSLRTTKDRPDQGRSKLNSELSLSEYLDLSFNETTGET